MFSFSDDSHKRETDARIMNQVIVELALVGNVLKIEERDHKWTFIEWRDSQGRLYFREIVDTMAVDLKPERLRFKMEYES